MQEKQTPFAFYIQEELAQVEAERAERAQLGGGALGGVGVGWVLTLPQRRRTTARFRRRGLCSLVRHTPPWEPLGRESVRELRSGCQAGHSL